MFDDMDRDIAATRLPRWGRVVSVDGPVPWLVVDDEGVPVEPIRRYLTDFVAGDTSLRSVRSYAFALLRWWRPARGRSGVGQGDPGRGPRLGVVARDVVTKMRAKLAELPAEERAEIEDACAIMRKARAGSRHLRLPITPVQRPDAPR